MGSRKGYLTEISHGGKEANEGAAKNNDGRTSIQCNVGNYEAFDQQ
jgi:hypothetical protein